MRESGSAGSRATVYQSSIHYRCSIQTFDSPPQGLAFGLPSFTDTVVGRSRTSAPSLQRWLSSPQPHRTASSASPRVRTPPPFGTWFPVELSNPPGG